MVHRRLARKPWIAAIPQGVDTPTGENNPSQVDVLGDFQTRTLELDQVYLLSYGLGGLGEKRKRLWQKQCSPRCRQRAYVQRQPIRAGLYYGA